MVGFSLSRRLMGGGQTVAKDTFLQFWTSRQMFRASLVEKIFHCFRQDGQEVRKIIICSAVTMYMIFFHSCTNCIFLQYLVYSDLQPLMDCILLFHPGLEFLKETAEFQKKYAETVIYRIFFSLNRYVPLSIFVCTQVYSKSIQFI